MTPFTRIVWKNEKSRDKWGPRLRRIRRLYQETEWEMTKRGYRKAATVHITFDNYFKIATRLIDDELLFLPIAKSSYYSGFSHCHRTPRRGQPYFIYGVLSRNKKDALRFKEMSSSPEKVHLELGKLLGYPRCCTVSFNQRWGAGIIDPMWEAALKTKGAKLTGDNDRQIVEITPSPYCNQLLRYFGIRITSHLPCSFDCKETIKKGKEWERVMKSIDREAYGWLKELLSLPLVWDAYRGILQVNIPLFLGITTTGYTEEKFIIKTK